MTRLSGIRRMTMQQALDQIDALKANAFPVEQKIQWLSEIDLMVWHEIYLKHEGPMPVTEFNGYDQDTKKSVFLLVPEPYTDIYENYVKMKIDLANEDNEKFMKNKGLFNAAFQTFKDFWRWDHMPIVRKRFITF